MRERFSFSLKQEVLVLVLQSLHDLGLDFLAEFRVVL
jgi:hypothetical protein